MPGPSTPTITAPPNRLTAPQWRSLESAHQARADDLTRAHRERRTRGERHPVEDFLWTYYSVKPAELRKWHPGAGVVLSDGQSQRATWRHYAALDRAADATHTPDADAAAADVEVDVFAFFAKRQATVDYVDTLLRRTLEHTPRFGCFGLHEWAMVYRMTPEQLRHHALDLRIGHEATDRVVEAHPISCTHFDAFRFFTPAAAHFNELQPTRETQPELEQSGCLHAGMDIYKWAAKLGPLVPGDLLLDAFVFARDIREVDMRASPYDVSAFTGADGQQLEAVPIETVSGKRQYAELQRGFAERGDALRLRLLDAISQARSILTPSERCVQPTHI